MWLQLGRWTALPVLAWSSPVVAQEASSEARLRVYADDDHVTVVSPSVATQFDASESVRLAIASKVDAVSAASVDVISSASPGDVNELRLEGTANATWSLSSLMRLRAGSVVSVERDYTSLRPSIGGQIEVANRNATIDLAYTAVVDSATHAIDESFKRKRRGHIVAAGLTQIADSSTYLDLLVDARRLDGYHASPYRRVLWRDSTMPVVTLLEERTPSIRSSGAAMLRLRRAMNSAATWFLHASYRFYRDSWEVSSHTVRAQLLREALDGRLLLSANLRGYQQGAADFYRAYYEMADTQLAPQFRTADRTLGGMHSLHGSVSADAEAGPVHLRSSVSLTQFNFKNFPAQRRRRAVTMELSVVTAW